MSFDPETYDPYKHYSPHHEAHQRINQTNSQAGLPAVLDWPEIDALAERASNATFYRLSDLDRNPDAQGFAMKTVHTYRDCLKAGPDGLLGERANMIDDGTLYALLGHSPEYAIALTATRSWKDIAHQHLSDHYTVCDVGITYGCDSSDANQLLAIKVGEFICLYKSCAQCREWFDEPPAMRDNLATFRQWLDDWDRR